MKEGKLRNKIAFFVLMLVLVVFSISFAYAATFTNVVSNCTKENSSFNLAGNYTAACSDPSGSYLRLNDSLIEVTNYEKGTKKYYGGVRAQSVNSSIINCLNITQVFICFDWWTDATSTPGNCRIGVSNDSNATITDVNTTCPGTTDTGLKCQNVTANKIWTCGNFFGISSNRATVENELTESSNPGPHNLSVNALFFNVTYNADNPPNVTLDSPTNGNTVAVNYTNFTCNATDDIKLSNITFYWNYTGTWLANGTNNVLGTSNQTNFSRTNLNNGEIKWNCYACDNLSQCSFASSNFTVTINKDITPPGITLNSPVNAFNSTSRSINFNWTATDNIATTLTCNLTINGTVNASNVVSPNSTATNHTVTNFADGNYSWNVTCNDTAGNVNTSSTRNFSVDATNPSINFTSTTETSGSFIARNNIATNVTANDTNLRNITRYIYNSTGSLVNLTTSTTSPLFNNISGFPDGLYYFNATAIDTFGNSNSTETRNVTLDTKKPAINFTGPTDTSGGVVGRNFTQVNVTANDTNLNNITVYLYNSTGGLVFNSTTSTSPNFVNQTNLADGLYYFNATAYDKAGNVNSTETRNITLDTTKPAISLVSPENNSYSTKTILVNITSSDIRLSTTWFNWNGTNATYSGAVQVNFTEGPRTLYAYANDTVGNLNTTNVSFLVDISGPSVKNVTPISGSSFGEGSSVNITANVTDAYSSVDKVLVNITWATGSEQAVMNNISEIYNFTFTNTNYIGLYNVTIIANDTLGNLNNTEKTNFTITSGDTISPLVSSDYPLNNTVTALRNITFNCSATDNKNLSNITLVINNVVNATNSVGGLSNSTSFNLLLSNNTYYAWYCNATDKNGNQNISNISNILINDSSVPILNETVFSGGNTTNWSAVPDLTRVCNGTAILDAPDDMIRWNDCVYAVNQNFSSYVNLSYNFVSVNFGLNETFNSSARIVMRNLPWGEIPLILRDGQVCNDTNGCYLEDYNMTTGTLIFNITHFTNYTTSGQTAMTIWDETDTGMPFGDKTKYPFQNVRFFANYTKNGAHIGSATCVINFTDLTATMIENATGGWYYYERNFSSNGTFLYNVTCNKTQGSQATLTGRDNVTITNDTVKPSIVLNAPVAGLFTNLTSINFNWTATDNVYTNLTCNLTINGSVNVSNIAVTNGTAYNVTVPGFSDGFRWWNVTCWDTLNNTNTSETRNFTVDTVKPSLTLNFPASSGTFVSRSWVVGNVSVTDTNFANVTLYLYNSSGLVFANFSTSSDLQINWTGLPNGIYFVNATAYDKAGNFNFSVKRNITLDTVKPSINLSYPPNGLFTNVNAINFNWTVTNGQDTNLSCNLSVAGVVYGPVDSLNNTATNYTVTGLGDGLGWWNVTCIDDSTNSNTSETRNFTVDGTPPRVLNVTPLAGSSYPNGTVVNITANVTDGSVVDKVLVNITWAAGSEQWLMNNISEIYNWSFSNTQYVGLYNVTIIANDSFGNVNNSEKTSFNITYVNQAPSVTLSEPADNYQFNNTNNVTLNFTVTDDLNATLNCSLYINGGLNQTNSSVQNATLTNFLVNVSFATYTWKVNCTDGLLSAVSGIRTFYVNDTLAPGIFAVVNTTITNESADIFWNTTEIANGTVDYGTTTALGSSQNNLTGGLYHYVALSGLTNNTLYYYNVTSCDVYGNCNTTGPYNFTTLQNAYVDQAPFVNLSEPLNNTQFNNTNSVTLNFTVVDDLNTSLNCSLYINGGLNQTNSSVQNATLTNFVVPVGLGKYNWSVDCSDGLLSNVSENRTFYVNDTINPSLSVQSPLNNTGYNKTNISLNYTVGDNYGVSSCWFTNVTGQNVTIAGCANTSFIALQGGNNITFYVNDTSNNVNSTTVYFYVDSIAPSLTVESPVNNSNYTVTTINLNFTAYDDNRDKCWYVNVTGDVVNLSSCLNSSLTALQGNNNITVYVNDTLNNVNSTKVFFFVDSLGPLITAVTNTTTNDSAVVNWTTDELANSTVDYGTTLALGGSVSNASLVTAHSVLITGLVNNTLYYYNVTSCDVFGNCNTSGPYNFTTLQNAYVNQAPFVNLSEPLNNTQFNNTNSVTLNFTVVDDLNTSLNCSLYINGGLNQTNSSVQNATLTNFVVPVGLGAYNWSVNCTDGSLSNGSEVRVFYVNDTLAPIVYAFSPQPNFQYNQSNTIYLLVNLSENSTVTANISWDSTSEVVTLVYNGTQWIYNASFNNTLFPGVYNVTLNSTDLYGNTNITYTNFTINDVDAPNVWNVKPVAGTYYYNGTPVNISANVTDLHYNSLDKVLVNVTWAAGSEQWLMNHILEIYNFTFTNTAYVGQYNVTIIANDTYGNVNNTEKTYFITMIADNIAPTVTSVYPENHTITALRNITFNCSATDNLGLSNISLLLNSVVNGTNDVSGVSNSTSFNVTLTNNTYYAWYCNATDAAGNKNSSAIFNIIINDSAVPVYNASVFNGSNTTNWSAIPDLTRVCNGTAVLDTDYDRVVWHNCVYAVNQDFNAYVNLSYNFVNVEFGLNETFDSNATITMRGLPWDADPIILRDGVECNETDGCVFVSYNVTTGNLIFNVTHFTNYSTRGNANLTIWDETDTGMPFSDKTKYPYQDARFFANYTKSNNFQSGATCVINFTDLNGVMTENTTGQYYYFNRSFNTNGTFPWNVTCSATGVNTLNTTDTVLINNDTVKPSIVLNAPVLGLFTNLTSINFNWTATDNVYTDLTCNLTINGSVNVSNIAVTNGTAYNVSVSDFSDGVKFWNVTCWDALNNTNTSETRNFTVDTVKPSINLSYPPNGLFTNVNAINFNWTVTNGQDTNLSCNLSVNGSVYGPVDSLNNTATNYTVTGLGDGLSFWNVTCVDDSTNSNTSETRNFTVDSTSPVFNGVYPVVNSLYNQSDVVVLMVNLSENATVYANVSWDSNSEVVILVYNGTNWWFNSTFSNTNFTGLYNVSINATDLFGNNNVVYTNFTINDVAPPIVLDVTPLAGSSYTNGTPVVITANVTDLYYNSLDKVLVNVTWAAGSEQWLMNNSSEIYNFTFTNTSYVGRYNVTIIANDTYGNFNNTEKTWFNMTYGNQAPVVTLSEPANDYQFNDTNSVTVNFTVTDDLNTTLSCDLYVNDTYSQSNYTTLNYTFTNFVVPVSLGKYNWSVNCTDGLLSAVSVLRVFYVNDTMKPSVSLNSPLAGIITSNTSFNFNWTAGDNWDASLTCNLTIDGIVNQSNVASLNETPTNYTVPGFLNGTHFWNVTCVDDSGNVNTSDTRNFTVDTVKPSITLNGPVVGFDTNINSINFNWTVTNGQDTNLTCNLTVNGSVYGPNIASLNDTATNYTVTGLGDGLSFWNVTCIDDAENINTSETRNFTVDSTSPSFNSVYPVINSLYNQSDVVVLRVNLSENATVTANISWDSTSEVVTLVYNGTEWVYNVTFTNTTFPGLYNVNINATDLFGNSNVAYTNFTVNDVSAPIVWNVTPILGSWFYNDTEVNITSNVTDPYYNNIDTVLVNVTWAAGSEQWVMNNISEIYNFTFTNTSYVGIYNVTIIANDTYGNVNNTEKTWFNITSSYINQPPVVTLNAPANGYEFDNVDSVDLNFSVTDDLNTTLNCSLYVNVTLNQTNDSTLNFTFTNFVVPVYLGAYSWQVNCTDGLLSAVSAVRMFYVNDTVNPSLSVQSPVNNTNYAVTAIELNYTVSDNYVISDCGYTNVTGQNISLFPSCANTTFTALQGQNNVTVYVNDTSGNRNSSTLFFFVDSLGPLVTAVTNITTNDTATINWSTDEDANSSVSYGLTQGLGDGSVSNVSFNTSHLVLITGLVNNTLYYYNVTSCDVYGNCNTTGPYNFTTLQNAYVNQAPFVNLSEPANQTQFNNTNSVSLNFTVVDDLNASLNCSLFVGGVLNQSNSSVQNATLTNFVVPVGLGNYNWSIDCSDGLLSNVSENRTFYVNDTLAPVFTNLANQTVPDNETFAYDIDAIDIPSGVYCFGVNDSDFNIDCSGILTNATGLSIGMHWLNITVNDTVGNENSGIIYVNVTNSTVPDTTPPAISLVNATSITNDSAIVIWTTNEASNSTVNFGNTTGLGTLLENSSLGTSHVIILTGLLPNTTYYYNVTSCDASGNCNTSGVYNFTTSLTPDLAPPVISDVVSSPTNSTSRINWTTDELANSTVNYGKTLSLGTKKSNSTLVFNHSILLTGLTNNTLYYYNITSCDPTGNCNTSGPYNFTTLSNADITLPVIINYTINPRDPAVGNTTFINASATDANLSGIFANITLPNGTVETITLPMDYNITLPGRYNVTIFANDTSGNTASVTSYFIAGNVPVIVQFNVVNNSFSWIPTSLRLLFSQTGDGIVNYTFVGNTVDIHTDILYNLFYILYGRNITIQLNNVNLSLIPNGTLGVDQTKATGYLITYGIYTNYTFTNAILVINYTGTGFKDENNLKVYRCANWNFTNRTCSGNWVVFNAVQNKATNTFTINTTGFSAYSIKQEATVAPSETHGGGASVDLPPVVSKKPLPEEEEAIATEEIPTTKPPAPVEQKPVEIAKKPFWWEADGKMVTHTFPIFLLIIVIVIIAFFIFFICKKRKKKKTEERYCVWPRPPEVKKEQPKIHETKLFYEFDKVRAIEGRAAQKSKNILSNIWSAILGFFVSARKKERKLIRYEEKVVAAKWAAEQTKLKEISQNVRSHEALMASKLFYELDRAKAGERSAGRRTKGIFARIWAFFAGIFAGVKKKERAILRDAKTTPAYLKVQEMSSKAREEKIVFASKLFEDLDKAKKVEFKIEKKARGFFGAIWHFLRLMFNKTKKEERKISKGIRSEERIIANTLSEQKTVLASKMWAEMEMAKKVEGRLAKRSNRIFARIWRFLARIFAGAKKEEKRFAKEIKSDERVLASKFVAEEKIVSAKVSAVAGKLKEYGAAVSLKMSELVEKLKQYEKSWAAKIEDEFKVLKVYENEYSKTISHNVKLAGSSIDKKERKLFSRILEVMDSIFSSIIGIFWQAEKKVSRELKHEGKVSQREINSILEKLKSYERMWAMKLNESRERSKHYEKFIASQIHKESSRLSKEEAMFVSELKLKLNKLSEYEQVLASQISEEIHKIKRQQGILTSKIISKTEEYEHIAAKTALHEYKAARKTVVHTYGQALKYFGIVALLALAVYWIKDYEFVGRAYSFMNIANGSVLGLKLVIGILGMIASFYASRYVISKVKSKETKNRVVAVSQKIKVSETKQPVRETKDETKPVDSNRERMLNELKEVYK